MFVADYFVFPLSFQMYKYSHLQNCNLPVVLYGYETGSLTLTVERRLRVFENMVLRKPFGHKRDEVTGEWRKLYNVELNDPKSLPGDPIKKNEIDRECNTNGRQDI